METTLIVTKDNLILVNDEKEEIKRHDVAYHLSRCIYFKVHHTGESNGSKTLIPSDQFDLPERFEFLEVDCRKVIAQSPNIKLSKELADELGWVDVEELAFDYFVSRDKVDFEVTYDFKKGFQKAQELNKNKYSEKDMEKCHFHGWFQRERLEMLGKPTYSYPSNWKDMDYEERESWFFEKFIQSLQQPKQIKVTSTEENGVFNVSKINEYK
jgi:hypothetical protein